MKRADRSAPIVIRPVETRRDLVRFVQLPGDLYRDDPAFIPPLIFERLQHLDPRRNPFFKHAEVRFWIAERDGRAVGRISAQLDRMVPDASDGVREGHFGFLDAEDSAETFSLLLGTAEAWLRERGAGRAIGPFSLSINDESGLLIKGFETPPFVMMGHAPRYGGVRMEEQRYGKAKDIIAYSYDLAAEPAPSLAAFLRKALNTGALSFRAMDPRRFDEEIALVVRIFNDAWAGNWGFVPFSNDDLEYLAKTIRPILRGGDVAFGELEGRPAAMAVCLPNVNEAIADFSGRVLPANWLKLLWRLKVKGLKTARLPLMGVLREHQGTPLGAALMIGVVDRVRAWHRVHGTEVAELSWILEENRPVRRVIEAMGGRPYKTYRLYRKQLA